MERYLDEELLAKAIGGSQNLPSQQDLSKLIADTEVSLLANNGKASKKLIEIGWYLFTIASIKKAYELYGSERQRAAFQVAGHIFDLALVSGIDGSSEKLRLVFASQIAYLKSQHQPNAIAIRKKHLKTLDKYELSPENYKDISLNSGVALLAFDIGYIYDATRGMENQATQLARNWNVNSLFDTPFGAALGLGIGCHSLISYLLYGKESLFQKAKIFLTKAVNCPAAYEDADCVWMATLLLGLVDELYNSSVWKVLPADVPDNIKRAFTLGSPRVLSLWPPQIDYLGNHNPFAENAKFQFLSTPTSGGKTLLAQILIAHHLSTRLTSACYIAPTRSLCREVTASMKDRLRYLNLKVKLRETIEDFDLDEDDIIEPTIDILTPESLAALVRKDAAAVFWKYGLFVFDEVHSVGDYGRGITIEQTISLLKTVSAENNTRIAMISAVIGNRSHFITWLSAGQNQVLESHSTWRGPRRINAIWNTNRSRTIEREEIIRGSVNVRRTYHKLFGQLTIRTSMTGNTTKVETIQPIGEIAMMYPKSNPRTMKRDPSKSLNHNGALVPLIELLAIRGPVLCIEATKLATVGLAKAIANSRADIDSDEVKELANFIEAKLSSAHPLSRVVKRGVAYHHGSLPNDIRTEIEKAVVDGTITALVATTTMTEGVNLPVQAVVISNVGSYQNNQEFLKFIKGPKMANAIGRAGRATKETEGCVVLFHKGQPSSETFKALDPDDEDKFISSNLTTAEFLAELSAYEASKLNNIDAILECKSAVLSGFFSFLWFYMYTVSPEGDPDETKINAYLENTMAWVQGSNEIKTSIVLLSNELKAKYVATDNNTRKIYAKSGSRLGTTKVLKEVYSTIMNDLSSNKSDIDILRTILNEATLPLILQVSEAPSKPIYNRRTVRTAISIPTIALLEDWINGMSYPDLSTKYLSAVADPDFRFEQLGEYITSYFDNFFPWVVGTIINWANESDEIEDAMPVHLPGLIRGGVPNEVALVALQQGIYSRQLAINISTWKATHAPEVSRYRIRVELQKNRISKLIENLNPSPSELRNLIEFLAEDKTQLLSELSGTGLCAITFWDNDNTSPGGCYIRGLGIRDNYELLRDQLVVGTIPTMYHVEIRTLLASGIPFACVISDDGAYLKLSVDGFETAG